MNWLPAASRWNQSIGLLWNPTATRTQFCAATDALVRHGWKHNGRLCNKRSTRHGADGRAGRARVFPFPVIYRL